MKKIIFLIGVLLYSVTSTAQNYYNFTKSTATYSDLVNPISISNGTVWTYNEFGPFNLPFPVTIFGTTHTKFGFDDDNFALANTDNQIVTNLKPLTILLADRNTNQGTTSLSPISYKVEGETGSRILKLEIKNAGLEDELDTQFGAVNAIHYLSYQIWFYEQDESFEFRFGSSNITDVTDINDGDAFLSIFYIENENDEETSTTLGYVNGTISNPLYTETTNPDLQPASLTSMIDANTVYRFSINTLANNDIEKDLFKMYPNPTTDDLNFVFEESLSKNYFIYDLLGREVMKGSFANEIQSKLSVSELQSGTYIIKIGNTTKKFIKK